MVSTARAAATAFTARTGTGAGNGVRKRPCEKERGARGCEARQWAAIACRSPCCTTGMLKVGGGGGGAVPWGCGATTWCEYQHLYSLGRGNTQPLAMGGLGGYHDAG